jgi:hypothetical protein
MSTSTNSVSCVKSCHIVYLQLRAPRVTKKFWENDDIHATTTTSDAPVGVMCYVLMVSTTIISYVLR